ncbi:MAG: hypothetical protein CVU39_21270 [Chloroflexi bacterium HGW-Chloroflexi-10]|nr:MAG: hypothetical protein CVU39_21270 [Chloroflexi bacterium HGW-Chloroflexi-10]
MNWKPAIRKKDLLKTLLVAVSLIIVIAWLQYAPPGLLGKMDAVGYAVCHRIEARSFHLGERSIPLCARCSGMHLGALLGLAFQTLWGRKGKLPPLKIMLVLGVFLVAFGVDGVNSYLHFFPNLPSLYEPNNTLRLITGTGLGLGIAAIIYPIFNQTIWSDWEDQPILGGWKELGALLGLAILLDLMILSENPLLLYPLAVLSGLNVLIILGICYTLIIILMFKQENAFTTWRSLWVPLVAGLTVAVLQTYLVDVLRFTFTGTWGGFNL